MEEEERCEGVGQEEREREKETHFTGDVKGRRESRQQQNIRHVMRKREKREKKEGGSKVKRQGMKERPLFLDRDREAQTTTTRNKESGQS